MPKHLLPKLVLPAGCEEHFVPLASDIFESWRKIGVSTSCTSHLVPGFQVSRNSSQYLILILSISGEGYAQFESDCITITPGTLFMSGPNNPITFGCEHGHWDMCWWFFDISTKNNTGYVYEPCTHSDLLIQCMYALDAEIGHTKRGEEWNHKHIPKNPKRALQLAKLIADYLHEFIEAPIKQSSDTTAKQLEVLWREVDRSLHLDWDVNSIAKQLGLSKASTQRRMRQYYGHSCHKELMKRRMERAKQLLRHSEHSLAELAQMIGYGHSYTFSNAFKKYTGSTPANYRDS